MQVSVSFNSDAVLVQAEKLLPSGLLANSSRIYSAGKAIAFSPEVRICTEQKKVLE